MLRLMNPAGCRVRIIVNEVVFRSLVLRSRFAETLQSYYFFLT